jgi:cellulose synthase (UDP-forming)
MNRPVQPQPSSNKHYHFSYRPRDTGRIRLLIIAGLLLMTGFVWIYVQPGNRGYGWLYALLTFSIVLKLVRLLHEWYHYWQVVPPVPPRQHTELYTVDVLTTYCPGEPYEMVLNTLRAIQAIRYPHTTYLCDEANDPYLREQCALLGVRHVTRTDRTNAKAGNINNALRQATGDICLIVDPDHIPVPDFLDQVLPYFSDPAIGFVQCVQAYYNQRESLVAFAATEQTYTFYGPMMTTMGNYGTAQAIGANCTFRRAALDSIGGHAPGLAEDMHTAMRLHAHGWQSVYVPLPLSYGLVPATLSAYYKQQLKWARGTFELLFVVYPALFRQFTTRQRLHYATMPLHYLLGLTQLADFLIPIGALLLLKLPLQLNLLVFTVAYVPLLAMAFLIRQYAQRWLIEDHEPGFHLLGGILSSGTWWVYVLGLVYTIFRVEVPYLPTPKDDKPRNNLALVLPNLLMAGLTLGAMAFSIYHYGRFALNNGFSQFMIGFGLVNVLILVGNVLIGQEVWLSRLQAGLRQLTLRLPLIRSLRIQGWHLRYGFYSRLRLLAFPLFLLLVPATMGLVAYTHRKINDRLPHDVRYATTQPFYYGVRSAGQTAGSVLPTGLPFPNRIIRPQSLTWTPGRAITAPVWSNLPNQLPLLYLKPMLTNQTVALHQFLTAVIAGRYDADLQRLFHSLTVYGRPVLVSFAPEFDNPQHLWGSTQETTLTLYARAWRHIALLGQARVPSGSWVWCPAQSSTIIAHYPGDDVVDWLGLAISDPSPRTDGVAHSFAAQYQQPHKTVRLHTSYYIRQKPILLTQLGQQVPPAQRRAWLIDALAIIDERYPEIRGILLSPDQIRAMKPTAVAINRPLKTE